MTKGRFGGETFTPERIAFPAFGREALGCRGLEGMPPRRMPPSHLGRQHRSISHGRGLLTVARITPAAWHAACKLSRIMQNMHLDHRLLPGLTQFGQSEECGGAFPDAPVFGARV